MTISPLHVFQAHAREDNVRPPALRVTHTVLVLGGGGHVGAALTQALLSEPQPPHVLLFARQTIENTSPQVRIHLVEGANPEAWSCIPLPSEPANLSALIVLDPKPYARAREQAIWHPNPEPEAVLALARWLFAAGVHSLCVVSHHEEMTLPQGVSAGFMNAAEEQLGQLPFTKLLLVRNARPTTQETTPKNLKNAFELGANWWFKIFRMMIPSSQRTVPHHKLATLVAKLMAHLPPGTHIVTPEQIDACRNLHRAEITALAKAWGRGSGEPQAEAV